MRRSSNSNDNEGAQNKATDKVNSLADLKDSLDFNSSLSKLPKYDQDLSINLNNLTKTSPLDNQKSGTSNGSIAKYRNSDSKDTLDKVSEILDRSLDSLG